LWPFELIEQIGVGGMGVVYRARYVVNDRHVALKMLPGDLADPTIMARFEREMEILKTLKHPHIVRCFGGVCENERRFYAMELVEGGTLEDRLKQQGSLPWEQVVRYGLQMCAALECSHEKGIVHRDVKPSNFLLAANGHLKLSDFGLASMTASRKITAEGKTAGTLLYMAPEQIRGKNISPRTDLYALGCVLYELVTGKPPFLGETPAATLHLHCHASPPRPTESAPDCPLALEAVILKLLEKSPDDRPASANEVARLLRSVNPTMTVEATVPSAEVLRTPRHASRSGKNWNRHVRQLLQRNDWRVLAGLVVALVLSLSWNVAHLVRSAQDDRWQRAWIEAVESPQVEVRIEALRVLGETVEARPANVPLLTQALQDDEPRVRLEGARSLQRAGPQARGSIPTLIKLQKSDPRQEVRDAAELALLEIRNAAPSKSGGGGGVVTLILLALLSAGGFAAWRWTRPT
jgi:eukaryotic-like serine/threonine-protein kinase